MTAFLIVYLFLALTGFVINLGILWTNSSALARNRSLSAIAVLMPMGFWAMYLLLTR
jgi:hypothetical protein